MRGKRNNAASVTEKLLEVNCGTLLVLLTMPSGNRLWSGGHVTSLANEPEL